MKPPGLFWPRQQVVSHFDQLFVWPCQLALGIIYRIDMNSVQICATSWKDQVFVLLSKVCCRIPQWLRTEMSRHYVGWGHQPSDRLGRCWQWREVKIVVKQLSRTQWVSEETIIVHNTLLHSQHGSQEGWLAGRRGRPLLLHITLQELTQQNS